MRSFYQLFSFLRHFRRGKVRDTFSPDVSADVPVFSPCASCEGSSLTALKSTPSESSDDLQPKIADAHSKVNIQSVFEPSYLSSTELHPQRHNNIGDADASESKPGGGPEPSTSDASTSDPSKPISPMEANPNPNPEADVSLSLNEHAVGGLHALFQSM